MLYELDFFEIYNVHPTILEFPSNLSYEKQIIYSIPDDNNKNYQFIILLTFGIFSKILSSNKIDILMNKLINKLIDKFIFYDYTDTNDYGLLTKPCNIKPPKLDSIPENENIETKQKSKKLPFLEDINKLKKNSLSTESLRTVELTDNEQYDSGNESEDSFHVGWVDIQN